MKLGAHGHMFCSALQFRSWYSHLVKKQDDGDDGDESVSDVEDGKTRKKTAAFFLEEFLP